MFKKIILIFVISLSFISFFDFSYAWDCKMTWDIKASLKWCVSNSAVLNPKDLKVATWFKELIISYINKISTLLAILAVWSIAYGSMVIVTSMGADERIKKWRNIIKWALLGFIMLVSAAWIIELLVYIIYWLK